MHFLFWMNKIKAYICTCFSHKRQFFYRKAIEIHEKIANVVQIIKNECDTGEFPMKNKLNYKLL